MAKLSAEDRKNLPDSAFAGPSRTYPVPDKSHAKNAKARASQAADEGRISKGEEKTIDQKADKAIKR